MSYIAGFNFLGRLIAMRISMVLVIIKMKVLPEKHMEISQTIVSLLKFIRKEQGCKYCDFCQSFEDKNDLFLLEEWNTRENLKSHLKSKNFMVLQGAMNLLKEPYEIKFHTVFHPEGTRGRGS